MTIPDRGPWTVGGMGTVIYSDDFTHDVALRVTGDFGSTEDLKEYSEWLAKTLNNAPRGLVK